MINRVLDADEILPRTRKNLYSLSVVAWLSRLSPELFWDVDREGVDPEKHAAWLLERVLERGRWEDWLVVRERYGKQGIRMLAPRLRLDTKTAHYLDLYCRS